MGQVASAPPTRSDGHAKEPSARWVTPLGEPQETRPLRRLWQLLRNRPRQGLKARHRRGQNEESTRLPTCCLVPPNQGGLEIAGHLKAWGKAVSWQITGIFPR